MPKDPQRHYDDQVEHHFHGTREDVPGDTLLPSRKTGRENYDYAHLPDPELRRTNVFMTKGGGYYPPPESAERSAWNWASGRGRARVHQVEPVGELRPDREGGEMAYMAPSAKIKDTIWTPPPGHSVPWDSRGDTGDWVVQGTIPHVNWNDYRNPHSNREMNWQGYSPKSDAKERRYAEAAERDRAPKRMEHIGQQQFKLQGPGVGRILSDTKLAGRD